MDFQKLVTLLWGGKSQGFVFLPTMKPDGTGFTQHNPYHYPDDQEALIERLQLLSREKINSYFTPMLFSQPERKKNLVSSLNLLWCDGDNALPEFHGFEPTILWDTSPGRWSAVWVLEDSFENLDAQQKVNRKLTLWLGTDKGGWDATQLLRIPTSWHMKAHPVKGVDCCFGNTYQINDLEFLNQMFTMVDENVVNENILFAEKLNQNYKISDLAYNDLYSTSHLLPGASRSEKLYYMVGRLFYEENLDDYQIVDVVKDTVLNKFNSTAKLHEDVRRILKKYPSPEKKPVNLDNIPETVSDRDLYARVQEFTEKIEQALVGNEAVKPLRSTFSSAFGEFTFPPKHWIVDNWFTLEKFGLIAGNPKAGKTFVLLTLALCLSTGQPFFGRKVNPCNVLLIEREDNREMVQNRINQLMKGMSIDRTNHSHDLLISTDYPFCLKNVQNLGALAEAIDYHQAKVVIIDTLGTTKGDARLNDQDDMVEIAKNVRALTTVGKCTVILIHHTKKGGESAMDASGSQQISAGWHFAMHVNRNSDGVTVLNFADGKESLGGVEDWKLSFNETEESLTWVTQEDSARQENNRVSSIEKMIIDQIKIQEFPHVDDDWNAIEYIKNNCHVFEPQAQYIWAKVKNSLAGKTNPHY